MQDKYALKEDSIKCEKDIDLAIRKFVENLARIEEKHSCGISDEVTKTLIAQELFEKMQFEL